MTPPARGLDPRTLSKMMRGMGIEMREVSEVEEVVVRTPRKEYVFRSPEVSIIKGKGIESWQIVGTPTEVDRTSPPFTEEDVDLVVSQTGANPEEARKALERYPVAEAIVRILEEKGERSP